MSRIPRTSHPRRVVALSLMALMCLTTALVATPAQADSNAVGPLSSEAQFVNQQYQDFLGRPADTGGRNFWVGKLKAGAPASDIVEALATSPEFEGRVAPVVRLYYAYFRRAPDIAGLRFWVSQLGIGANSRSISQAFADAPEFQNTYGALTDGEFVDLVYQNVLGRSADQTGRTFWLDAMSTGTSRGDIMLSFSESVENVRLMDPIVKSTMLYVGLLDRRPEAAGLDYWAQVIGDGGSYSGVVGGFLGSAEYRVRMQGIYAQRQPLTGERVTTPYASRAIAVKVDNKDSARPQKNLQFADIVIEEEVEYSLTRFIAIYHSEIPAVVGPTRSVRTTDFGVLGAYNTPLLVTSGGNTTVLSILDQFDGSIVLNRNEKKVPSAYFRDNSRSAPHNLYARTATIRNSAPAGSAPQAIFGYREPGVPSTLGGPTNGVRVDFGANDVSYQWNQAARGWQRTQNGRTHKMDDGTIIAPDNVVVLEVIYSPSVADGNTPEANTAGSGVAHIFTDGRYIAGTWLRPTVGDSTTLRDNNGNDIGLTPGETWVALARKEDVTLR